MPEYPKDPAGAQEPSLAGSLVSLIVIGSPKPGPKDAIASAVETCRLDINLRTCPLATLPGLGQQQGGEVGALKPAAWKAARANMT